MVYCGYMGFQHAVSPNWEYLFSGRYWYDSINKGSIECTMIQIEKFRRLMEDISAERGEFVFFGLFLREEAVDKWDLVISAPWIEADKLKALREFVEKATP